MTFFIKYAELQTFPIIVDFRKLNIMIVSIYFNNHLITVI